MAKAFLEMKVCPLYCGACTETCSSRGPRTPKLYSFFIWPIHGAHAHVFIQNATFFFSNQKKKVCRKVYAKQHAPFSLLRGRSPRIYFACDIGGCPNILFCPSVRYGTSAQYLYCKFVPRPGRSNVLYLLLDPLRSVQFSSVRLAAS